MPTRKRPVYTHQMTGLDVRRILAADQAPHRSWIVKRAIEFTSLVLALAVVILLLEVLR